MTERREIRRVPAALRSIEAAAIAGFVHSALSLIATWWLFDAPDPADGDRAIADWYADGTNQARVIAGLNLLVISGISFVWFVAVIRRRVGVRENRFFGTVFLGSALLLTGAWFVAGVLIATPAVAAQTFDIAPDAGVVAVFQAAGLTMASVVATRLEAVFIISTTTVGRLSEAFPRWLVVGGYVIGLTLLLIPVPNVLLTYVFPIWVAATSATLLVRRNDAALTIPVNSGTDEINQPGSA
jgi:hypothetical protein